MIWFFIIEYNIITFNNAKYAIKWRINDWKGRKRKPDHLWQCSWKIHAKTTIALQLNQIACPTRKIAVGDSRVGWRGSGKQVKIVIREIASF